MGLFIRSGANPLDKKLSTTAQLDSERHISTVSGARRLSTNYLL